MSIAAEFGAPASITQVGGKVIATVIGVPGTAYTVGDVVTGPGGFAAHVATITGPGPTGPIATLAIDNHGKDYSTEDPITLDFSAGTGADAEGTGTVEASAWEMLFYPRRLDDDEIFGLTEYVHLGNDAVGGHLITGRQVGKTHITADPMKRVVLDMDMGGTGLGHSHTGFSLGKSTNSGTFAGLFNIRGVREQDAAWLAEKSFYAKVSAVGTDGAGNAYVDFVGKFDDASELGDGTDFPAGAYGTDTFRVQSCNDATGHDGYTTALDENGDPIGPGGEDRQPFQLTASGDLSGGAFAVGDQFEFPRDIELLSASYVSATQFSTFHGEIFFGTRKLLWDKATLELDWAAKPDETGGNGTRYAAQILREGDPMLSFKYDDNLYDSYIRNLMEANSAPPLYFKLQDLQPIDGSSKKEGMEVYAPQSRVMSVKEREVTTKNTLKSSPSIQSEEPESTVACAQNGSLPGTHVLEILITLSEDPTTYFATL
jgi:hypothetical protein